MIDKTREQFGTRIGFILAAAGSAVGLGNIWRFPYVTGQNGGGIFLLCYIIMIFLIGGSVMLAEFAIGRGAQLNGIGAFKKLKGGAWPLVGWLGLAASMIILSFYSVIGGWTIKYLSLVFSGLLNSGASGKAGELFGSFIGNTWQVVFFQGVFMLGTVLVVFRGVGKGIERFCKIFMPALFVIILILIVRSLTLPGAWEGVSFYLKPDLSKLTGQTLLAALGQAFFSLSLGNGGMLIYGSYLGKKENLPKSAAQICFLDTLVAFLSGLVIFPAVFAFGFEPGSGAGLTFITLPAVFAKMVGGHFWAFLFFTLLVIASLSSSINMLEIVSSYFIDELGWTRRKAASILGTVIFFMGLPSAYSLTGNLKIWGKDFLDAADFLASNIMMPLGGLFIVIFVGWIINGKIKEEVTNGGQCPFALFSLWTWICRLVAPIAICWIFIKGLNW